MSTSDDIYDVIVVGAGISGLTAAYTLKKKNKDLKLLIIEAKDRVGGRTQTIQLKVDENRTANFDVGGQWVTDAQTHITRIINELELETYIQYIDGKKVIEYDGKIRTYSSTIPRISIFSLIDLQLMLSKINSSARGLSAKDPFENGKEDLDTGNLSNFLNAYSSTSRSIVSSTMRTVFGLETNQINTLFGLWCIKTAGGSIESLVLAEKGCAQEKKVKGGTQQISQKLLEKSLVNDNDRFLTNMTLIEVNMDQNFGVEIKARSRITGDISTFKSKKIISAIPLNQYENVKFHPELSFERRNVFKFCRMGNLVKVLVTYPKPFWRLDGFSGEVVSDGSIVFTGQENRPNLGPIAIVFDACNIDGDAALVAFVGGEPAIKWLDKDSDTRKKEILESLVRYFGKKAMEYIDYYEKNWIEEEYSGGCPMNNIVCSGIMKDFSKATREPFMNLHFCGTETATEWMGYMDGAVQSGERAANEVLNLLDHL